MNISINQSLCGEKAGAWDLLKTTIKDPKVAQAIAFKTDLHDTASGKNWGPSIRGFCFDEYFLIIKSFVDPSTTVRPGRAFSHVLILDKKHLEHINDLRPLFEFLPNEVDKNAQIGQISIELSKLKKTEVPTLFEEPFLGRFKKVISGYVNYTDWSNTIVWVGEQDYNEAVAALWERLTTDEKKIFNFDIYFNANAVPKSTLNLISISERHLSKFQNAGFLIVGLNDNAELSTLSEQILAGHKESHDRITNFANAIDAVTFPRTEWNTVSIVLNTFENFEREKDLKRLATLSHIIATYSSSPKKGAAFKKQLVGHIASLIVNSTYQQFSILKTFKVEAFSKSENVLGKAIKQWLKQKIFKLHVQDQDALTILNNLKQPIAKDWLSRAVVVSFDDFFDNADAHNLQICYEWLSTNPSYLQALKPYLLGVKEQILVSALPHTVSEILFGILKSYAVERNLYVLHAILLLSRMSTEDALSEQIKIDKEPLSTKALDIIFAKGNDAQIIKAAIEFKDPRIISKAGSLCNEKPFLLTNINISDLTWQDIWAEAIRLGNGVDDGIKQFGHALNQLFELIIQGVGVNQALLTAIANSNYANVLSYSKRNELWSKLDGTNKNLFLKATSANLLRELSNGKNLNVPNDPILSKYVFDHAISDFLYFNNRKMRPVIPIFMRFSNIPNYYLEDYVRQFQGILDGKDAKNLGKVIYQRGSSLAANIVFHRSAKNNSWAIALKECYSLLSFVDKAKIFLSGLIPKVKVSKEQWWTNVEQLLCNYYPNPVSLTRVWQRAGGHESDLLLGVTARETWGKAIKKVKNKEVKKITMNSLLKEVNEEFGHVEDFKFLYKIRKPYI